MELTIRVVATVTGRVQGVGYRYAVYQKAKGLGVTGFVKNQADGSVYLEAEGLPEHVMSLIDWCRIGPERAGVDSVKYEVAAVARYEKFQIR